MENENINIDISDLLDVSLMEQQSLNQMKKIYTEDEENIEVLIYLLKEGKFLVKIKIKELKKIKNVKKSSLQKNNKLIKCIDSKIRIINKTASNDIRAELIKKLKLDRDALIKIINSLKNSIEENQTKLNIMATLYNEYNLTLKKQKKILKRTRRKILSVNKRIEIQENKTFKLITNKSHKYIKNTDENKKIITKQKSL